MSATTRSIGMRWAVPVTGKPLHNAKMTIHQRRIQALEPDARHLADKDLGECIVMPGLVNAHTHLEFSNLAAPLGHAGISLTQWIPLVIEHRFDQPDQRLAAIQNGCAESTRFGTLAAGDISTTLPLSDTYAVLPHVTCFLEGRGNQTDRVTGAMKEAHDFACRFAVAETGETPFVAGLSPHAPYSVDSDLFRQLITLAVSRRMPVAMHLAESREEIQWLQTGGGAFADLLTHLGASPDKLRREKKPLDYLAKLTEAHRALVIHGNYLETNELDFVSRFSQLHVVYCPRTHQFFHHDTYPLLEMLKRKINVAIGTDSRASNPDLSVWRELKMIRRLFPTLDPRQVLSLGTVNGAIALGVEDQFGSLQPGRRACVLSASLGSFQVNDPESYLLDAAGDPQPLDV